MSVHEHIYCSWPRPRQSPVSMCIHPMWIGSSDFLHAEGKGVPWRGQEMPSSMSDPQTRVGGYNSRYSSRHSCFAGPWSMDSHRLRREDPQGAISAVSCVKCTGACTDTAWLRFRELWVFILQVFAWEWLPVGIRIGFYAQLGVEWGVDHDSNLAARPDELRNVWGEL